MNNIYKTLKSNQLTLLFCLLLAFSGTVRSQHINYQNDSGWKIGFNMGGVWQQSDMKSKAGIGFGDAALEAGGVAAEGLRKVAGVGGHLRLEGRGIAADGLVEARRMVGDAALDPLESGRIKVPVRRTREDLLAGLECLRGEAHAFAERLKGRVASDTRLFGCPNELGVLRIRLQHQLRLRIDLLGTAQDVGNPLRSRRQPLILVRHEANGGTSPRGGLGLSLRWRWRFRYRAQESSCSSNS